MAAYKASQATGNGQSLFNALAASLNPPDTPNDLVLCICNRPLQDILCRACGYIFTGRARKQCPYHRNAILLMDTACCPKCKVTCLLEFGVSDTPTKRTVHNGEEPGTHEDDTKGHNIANPKGKIEKMQGDGKDGGGDGKIRGDSDLNPAQKKVVEAWEDNVITVVKNSSPIKSRVSKDIRFGDVRQ